MKEGNKFRNIYLFYHIYIEVVLIQIYDIINMMIRRHYLIFYLDRPSN